jgi:hypothetical protein
VQTDKTQETKIQNNKPKNAQTSGNTMAFVFPFLLKPTFFVQAGLLKVARA